MRVLVACEFSGIVRDAFITKGHDAVSCDFLPTEKSGPHIQGDVLQVLNDGWDLMIAHPPCTYLSYAGIRWFNIKTYGKKAIDRFKNMVEAIEFFYKLYSAPIDKICIENPRGFISTYLKPTQLINPYYFGDEATKPTYLWLKNLPQLIHIKEPTLFGDNITHVNQGEMIERTVNGKKRRDSKWYYEAVSLPPQERQKFRSKTFLGIAEAMAEQWGS